MISEKKLLVGFASVDVIKESLKLLKGKNNHFNLEFAKNSVKIAQNR